MAAQAQRCAAELEARHSHMSACAELDAAKLLRKLAQRLTQGAAEQPAPAPASPAPTGPTKYRPVDWSNIHNGRVVGWGIARKRPGERRYVPVAYRGKLHPFKTREAAQAVCEALMSREADQ